LVFCCQSLYYPVMQWHIEEEEEEEEEEPNP
jgi:hypothetical protein